MSTAVLYPGRYGEDHAVELFDSSYPVEDQIFSVAARRYNSALSRPLKVVGLNPEDFAGAALRLNARIESSIFGPLMSWYTVGGTIIVALKEALRA